MLDRSTNIDKKNLISTELVKLDHQTLVRLFSTPQESRGNAPDMESSMTIKDLYACFVY